MYDLCSGFLSGSVQSVVIIMVCIVVHSVCNENDGNVVQFCNGEVWEGLDS